MHVSAPVRVRERDEWAPSGLREFGLEPPGYNAILYRGSTPVLGAEFGAANPQKVLQYMKVQGHDQVYLMSRFIGEAWGKVRRAAVAGRSGCPPGAGPAAPPRPRRGRAPGAPRGGVAAT